MRNAEILAITGLRVDGRRPTELRCLRHKLNVLPSADGSCYFEQGLNKVLVVVHGPHEPFRRDHGSVIGKVSVRVLAAPFSGTERKRRRHGDQQ